MKLANFPILIPAFTAQESLPLRLLLNPPLSRPTDLRLRIPVEAPLAIGSELVSIPFRSSAGQLVLEPAYPYVLHADFLQGSDFVRRDPNGLFVRLDVRSVARDARSGHFVVFSYGGLVDVSGPAGRVIAGDHNASTIAFGHVFIQARFEARDPQLLGIENKIYVGSGRFIVRENEPVVEYKISEVAAACGH